MKKVKVELKFPITMNGAELKVLEVRRPTVRDMLSIEKSTLNDAEKEINLFANLCEVAPDSLHNLDMADYAQLQKVYQDFLS